MLQASAYRATSRRVFRSPPPPIITLGIGYRWIGQGTQIVSANW